MKTLLRNITLLAALSIGGTASVTAAPIIDQSQAATDGGVAFWSDLQQAQTFTAGITGQLTQLDVPLGLSRGVGFTGDETAYISLVEWGTNMPGTVLGSTSVLLSGASTLQSLDLTSENIFLTAGSMYAFVLSNDLTYYNLPDPYRNTGIQVQWSTDPYTEGSLWTRYSTGWAERSGTDTVFTTYVNASPVPAPSILFLFAAGLAGLGYIRRKQA